MHRKDFARKRPWLQLRYCPGIYLERLEKTVKIQSQDSWCPSRDSNQTIPEYNSEAMQVGPIYVVSVLKGKGGRRNKVGGGWVGGIMEIYGKTQIFPGLKILMQHWLVLLVKVC
jgi:hypothetical protein